jgi:hypothetical protein
LGHASSWKREGKRGHSEFSDFDRTAKKLGLDNFWLKTKASKRKPSVTAVRYVQTVQVVQSLRTKKHVLIPFHAQQALGKRDSWFLAVPYSNS